MTDTHSTLTQHKRYIFWKETQFYYDHRRYDFSPFTAEQRYKENELSFLNIHLDFVFTKVSTCGKNCLSLQGFRASLTLVAIALKV